MIDFLTFEQVTRRYGSHLALSELSLTAPAGAFVALLGPNGSGKTTLFRILAGLLPPTAGDARIFGRSVVAEPREVSRSLGVVFQSPSLDPKLTVRENLQHHGHLYGLRGKALRERIGALLARLELEDRADWRVGTLSGGLQRQVELVRCLLHRPRALLLDEPTTGLDPSARLRFWTLLRELARDEELSALYTTHWFEEADHAELVGILDHGRLVAWGTPDGLKQELGGEVVRIKARDPRALADALRSGYGVDPRPVRDALYFTTTDTRLASRLMADMGDDFDGIQVSRPTLEDVFVAHTGTPFEEGER